MFNLQVLTERDRREAASIERRRAAEEERKKRIFNPRQRLLGLDHDYLQRQIAERKRRDADDALLNKAFDDQRRKYDEIAIALEEKERQERVKLQREINHFRTCCQRPEDRREFDLNDPQWRKKELPARACDDDPRLGPSAAQKFEGEDLKAQERAKVQREQMKAWLDQQVEEKEAAEKERRMAEAAYREAVAARQQRALQLEQMEKECRKRLEDACLRFNRALADERKMEEMKKLKKEHEDSLAEMYNFITSDMLTENREVEQSNLGPGKSIKYMYKGMTEEEQRKIREYQLAQIEEVKQKKEFEKRKDREYEDYINGTQRTVALMDKEQQQKQKELVRSLAEDNRKLAEEQKLRNDFLNKVVYTNRPSPEFYDQFNKTTR